MTDEKPTPDEPVEDPRGSLRPPNPFDITPPNGVDPHGNPAYFVPDGGEVPSGLRQAHEFALARAQGLAAELLERHGEAGAVVRLTRAYRNMTIDQLTNAAVWTLLHSTRVLLGQAASVQAVGPDESVHATTGLPAATEPSAAERVVCVVAYTFAHERARRSDEGCSCPWCYATPMTQDSPTLGFPSATEAIAWLEGTGTVPGEYWRVQRVVVHSDPDALTEPRAVIETQIRTGGTDPQFIDLFGPGGRVRVQANQDGTFALHSPAGVVLLDRTALEILDAWITDRIAEL